MRLLAAGVTVSRTDDDLVRYHGKLMIIDRRVLFLLAFNFTWLDMERSRSFGIVTTNKKHVEQAAKAVRRGYQTSAIYGGQRHLRRQPHKRAQTTHRVHQGSEKRTSDLRSRSQRSGDHPGSRSARQGGRDRQNHRQTESEERRAAGGENTAYTIAHALHRARWLVGLRGKPESPFA